MAGLGSGSAAVEQAYAGVADGILADEPAPSLPTRIADVLMDTPEGRSRVAEAALLLTQTLE
jgi:hypothetical protein